VLPELADHKLVLSTVKLKIPTGTVQKRMVWDYAHADWLKLREELEETDWTPLNSMSADNGAEWLTTTIKAAMQRCIPQHELREYKCTHPWLNEHILNMVKAELAARGTLQEQAATLACREALGSEFMKYVEKMSGELLNMKKGCKLW
jgi:hypothetical protein